MKTIGIVQFTQVGYPVASKAVEFEVYEDGVNQGWTTCKVTDGQASYIRRLSDDKKASYILKHFC